jgi:hypothetical protein
VGQPTRLTLFAFRHLVQTFNRFGVPPTTTRILCTLGFHRRRDRRWECEMLFPNPGVFPQMSHTEDITAAETTKDGIFPRPTDSLEVMGSDQDHDE